MKPNSNRDTIRRLSFCNFKLDTLLEITQAINDNEDVKSLLKRYEAILQNQLHIGKILLFQYNNGWDIILESGFLKGTFIGINVEASLSRYTEIETTSSADELLLQAFDIVIPVYHNKKPIAYVLVGDIDEEKQGISPTIKHLRFIQTFTNIIMVAIENKRLIEDNLRQEAMKKELELASQMQEMLVPNPKSFPHNEKIYIDAFYHPHFKVGGDYYDYIQLSSHEFGFCIADVSGKGMSAALLMSNFQASLRALFTSDISLADLVVKLNRIVMKNTQGDKFITLFIGKFNFKSKKLQYINAGHNPPSLYDVFLDKIIDLEKGCTGLGMLDEIPKINVGVIRISNNSKLLCFTDGLVEIEDDSNNPIGQDIINKYIASDNRIDGVIANIIRELNIIKGNAKLFDDITMLGIDFF